MTFKLLFFILIFGSISICTGLPSSLEKLFENFSTAFKSRDGLAAIADGKERQGKYSEAIWYYTKAIDKNPEHCSSGKYYAKRGNCHLETNQLYEAFSDYKNAIQYGSARDSYTLEDNKLAKLGKLLYNETRAMSAALWCYDQAIARNPNVADYYKYRGNCYLGVDLHSQKATYDFYRMLQLDPDNENNRDYFVEILLSRFIQFDQFMEDALRFLPDNKLVEMGDEFLYSKKVANHALKCYNAAIAKNNDRAEYFEKRALCILKLNHSELALSDLKAQLKIEPDNMNSWYFLVRTLYHRGRIAEVEEEVHNLNEDQIVKLGKAFFSNKRFEYAVFMYTLAIKKNPKLLYFKLRAICYMKLQNKDGAEEDARHIRKEDSSFTLDKTYVEDETEMLEGFDFTALGHKFIFQEEFEEALRCYSVAIKNDPKCALCYGKRGICHRKLKNAKAALEDFQESLKLDPSNMHVQTDLCDILIELGRLEEAKKEMRKLDNNIGSLEPEEVEKLLHFTFKTLDIKLPDGNRQIVEDKTPDNAPQKME